MLKSLRAQAGMSQWDVARIMGVPQTVISKIELGTRRIDVVELIAYTQAVGAKPAEFVERLEASILATKAH